MLLKVIACEIAFREICFAAAQSHSVVDLEFLTQGHHDHPCAGRAQVQAQIDAVPEGRYDAILIGYGLCSTLLVGLTTAHTPLVIPRAHDCITFFLGSKERYLDFFLSHPGTYYYSSGWLECRQRAGERVPRHQGQGLDRMEAYLRWVGRYGEERARELLEMMDRMTANYTHGVLIDFDFTRPLSLRQQVESICAERGWQFEEVAGDLRLLQRWLDGEWDEEDFLVVRPREKVVATYDEKVITVEASAA